MLLSLASGACQSDSGGGPEATPSRVAPPVPAEAPLRRLTSAQYLRIVSDVVGPEGVLPARLEEDSEYFGLLSLGAANTSVSFAGVERYERAAYLIAEQALAGGPNRQRLVPCEPQGVVDAQCAEQFVRELGRKLWRRGLTDGEVATFAQIAVDVASDPAIADFHRGLELALAGLLQSPDFIYRVEVGAPAQGDDTRLRFSDVEMASRLSFLFWGDAPDEELLAVAEAGGLSDPATLSEQVGRLIADERIKNGIRTFFDEMLKLGELGHLEKDPTVFTAYSAELGPSAREQTLLDLEKLVIAEDGDFRGILTSTRTHVDRTLAAVYRVPAPSVDGFALTVLPPDQGRVGLFGHASFLALNSHAASTSAVKRGKFVQEVLLCNPIPPPPPNVNTVLPEVTEEAVTLRDRVGIHLTDPVCASCHELMDPIGLAFETFDAIGTFRSHDQHVEIDASGVLRDAAFDDAAGLARVIAADPNFTKCFVDTLHSYAVGTPADGRARGELDELRDRFVESGYRVLEVMRAIATSPRFWDAAVQVGDSGPTCDPMPEDT